MRRGGAAPTSKFCSHPVRLIYENFFKIDHSLTMRSAPYVMLLSEAFSGNIFIPRLGEKEEEEGFNIPCPFDINLYTFIKDYWKLLFLASMGA